MLFKRNPVYRRSIYPWYDTELACIVMILFSSIIFYFGIVGISVAREKYEYQPYTWVPAVITAFCGIVILSNTIRLVLKIYRRYTERATRTEIGPSQDQ